MSDRPRQVGVWTSPERLALVRAVTEACGLSVTHAGAPDAAQTRRVAAELHAAAEDDLRRMIVDPAGAAGVVLIADAAPDPGPDARTIAQAAARGGRIATLEPIPNSAIAMVEGGWLEGIHSAGQGGRWFLGALRTAKALRDAAEVLERFGAPGAVFVESVCGPSEGSLGARLFDALDLVRGLLGEAETVWASYTPALPGSAAGPGEGLTGLTGSLAVGLRFAGGRSACVAASDRGAWRRTATLIGAAGGRMTLTDGGFEWRDAAGAVVDASAPEPPPAWPAAAALTEALSRFVDPASPAEAPGDLAAVMAMAQAAVLSARTGQAESTATIRRMVGLA